MRSLLYLAALMCLVSVAVGSGIRIGIPLPFIKLRFVDIANLFGDKHGGGHHGGGASFGLEIGGGHGGHHGHGW